MKAILKKSPEVIEITHVRMRWNRELDKEEIELYFSGYDFYLPEEILKTFDDFDQAFSENWY
jgi:hypothetical protein